MKTEASNQIDYQAKETEYFSYFALAHLSALKPHYQKGGILKRNERGDWKATQHCLAAGAYADLMIDLLGQTGLPEYQVDQETKKKIVDAAILHDWHKKLEIEMTNRARQAGTYSYETVEEIKKQDTSILSSMGYSEEIIALTGANVPEDATGPTEFSKQIIWYVDAMLSVTNAVPINQRFDDLDRGWTGTAEDPTRAARNKAFSAMYVDNYNGTPLFDVQRAVASRLNREFSTALNYEGDPEELPVYLKNLLQDRILNFKHPNDRTTESK